MHICECPHCHQPITVDEWNEMSDKHFFEHCVDDLRKTHPTVHNIKFRGIPVEKFEKADLIRIMAKHLNSPSLSSLGKEKMEDGNENPV